MNRQPPINPSSHQHTTTTMMLNNTGPKHLNGYRAIQNYLQRIFYGDGKCPAGTMKALLLDSVTTQIVSAVYSQTDILREQIYYVTKLGKNTTTTTTTTTSLSTSNNTNGFYDNSVTNQPPSHLKAIVLIRPTNDNIDLLVTELQKPIFVEYHIFVTGPLDAGLLKILAENDRYEKVIQVQEYYVDFIPIHDDLVSLQCRQTVPMSMVAGTSWAPQYAIQYERNLLGLQALLLAFQRRPTVIRYAAASPCAEELAKDLYDTIQADDIYHFRSTTSSSSSLRSSTISQQPGGGTPNGGMVLLIVDRRDDPVTPLLSQWTYQAMVHELLGLNNHRVLLRGAPNISKELEEVVLNVTDDEFFAQHRNSNFGELGEAIQQLLHDYQSTTSAVQQTTSNLTTIEDIQAFMEKYPELRSKSYTVSKHVAIMGELARLVEQCSLMDVSQFEQSLACNDNSHNDHYRELMEKLNSPHIKIPDKLRLGLLYALRYEQSGNLHMIQQAMTKGGVPPDLVNLVPALLRYGGSSQRSPGLYGENHHLVSKMTKTLISTVQGIQNVYSQHVPAIMETLQSIVRGKLSSKHYPVLAVPPAAAVANSDALASQIPDEIIIFMVGGITYEEGTKINEFNYQQQQLALKRGAGVGVGVGGGDLIRVVLAGSTVHNSTSFLDELKLSNQAMGGKS